MRVATEEFFCYVVLLLLNWSWSWSWSYSFGLNLGLVLTFWSCFRHCLGSCLPNLKFLSLAILELLAFNTQKLRVTWPWPRPIFANFLGSCRKFGSRRLCQISSKLVKNCNCECVGHRTPDIKHGKWFYIFSNAAMHSIGQTTMYTCICLVGHPNPSGIKLYSFHAPYSG